MDTTAPDTTHLPCLCGERRLLTVKQVCALPVMEHMSTASLYRHIERGEFPHYRPSEKKVLVLVTAFCPAHRVKTRDHIDEWLEALDRVYRDTAA